MVTLNESGVGSRSYSGSFSGPVFSKVNRVDHKIERPGELLFRNSAGVVSTTFNTFGADQGTMTLSGPFAFDSSITHVLQEVAPGWHFDSPFVCWLPFQP